MSKSFKKRGAACKRLNDSAIRRTIDAVCNVFADLAGPEVNSRTLTSPCATCSSTRGPLEDLHLDRRTGPECDRQIAVGDVAPDREAIRAAAEPSDDRPVGIDGLSAIHSEVLLVADQQGPQTPRDARGSGGHQRVPA